MITNEDNPDAGISFNHRLDIQLVYERIERMREAISSVIVGQESTIELLMVALLANGHVLLEGVPGIAKTLLAKLFARTINAGFSRVQFTPDLMPGDVIGTLVYDLKSGDFIFRQGPVFSNIILIDEINRSPAKTQSSLFEVMEERQISMDGKTHHMSEPFMVIATQNPIEYEGTYRLPEAQLDRFLFKLEMSYPSDGQEVEILRKENSNIFSRKEEQISPVLNQDEIAQMRQMVRQVLVEENLIQYIAAISDYSRYQAGLYLGASPRASIAILNAAKAMALVSGRDFVTPDDIKAVTKQVLVHRIILSPTQEMDNLSSNKIINQILENVKIPR